MWTRRVDLKICEPLTNGFRFAEGLPLFESRMRCLPEAAAGLKAVAQDGLRWLDPLIAGRDFIAGDRSEEHTSELQSLMRISYAVFCLKKKKSRINSRTHLKSYVHEIELRQELICNIRHNNNK